MAMLETHLQQICLSAQSTADLQFPSPGIFTNALLGNHEITTLIRDTEPHERALFTLNPNTLNSSARSARRTTAFGGTDTGAFERKSTYASAEPRKRSAVARVLGTDMLQEIRKSSGNASSSKNGMAGGVNVEVLLMGAERLCAVYPVAGASEKITSLRHRHQNIIQSIAHHEEKVAKQQTKLNKINKAPDHSYEPQQEEEEVGAAAANDGTGQLATEQDIELEELEIRDLEAKKRALDERVSGMEKDLGGLLI